MISKWPSVAMLSMIVAHPAHIGMRSPEVKKLHRPSKRGNRPVRIAKEVSSTGEVPPYYERWLNGGTPVPDLQCGIANNHLRSQSHLES